jgi:hypothetical protein
MIGICLNAMRVGLLPRWMGILGMVCGVTIFLPVGSELQILIAFWMVMMGVMCAGRWPRQAGASTGDPPAWAAGEARPWPSRAPVRASVAAAGAGGAVAATDLAPAPAPAPRDSGSARRRRRKRGPGPRN